MYGDILAENNRKNHRWTTNKSDQIGTRPKTVLLPHGQLGPGKNENKKHKRIHEFVGFLRGRYSRGGGNWGTLKIPREDWGTLGNIRDY